MIDPDKKVEEFNKKNSNLYQSSEHPEHFQNEGGEFIQLRNNKKDDSVNASEKEDQNPMKGC